MLIGITMMWSDIMPIWPGVHSHTGEPKMFENFVLPRGETQNIFGKEMSYLERKRWHLLDMYWELEKNTHVKRRIWKHNCL